MSTTTVHTARKTRPCANARRWEDHDIQAGAQYLRHVAFPGDEGHEEGTRPWVVELCSTCTARDMEYMRSAYRVPAEVGMRVTVLDKSGRIVGSDGGRLLIVIDGEKQPGRFHPTYKIQYHSEAVFRG